MLCSRTGFDLINTLDRRTRNYDKNGGNHDENNSESYNENDNTEQLYTTNSLIDVQDQ
jgi:hypothetical protein